MKVLDVKELDDAVLLTTKQLKTLESQVSDLQQAVKGMVMLDDTLKGMGGDAIRSFYAGCHKPLIVFLQNFFNSYKDVLSQIKQAVHSYESQSDGFVRESFLQNEIEQGLQEVKNVAGKLTDATNQVIQQVSDIVSLPMIHDDEFASMVQQASKNKNETIEQLYTLDQSQTNTLESIKADVVIMKNYVTDLEGKFRNGDLTVENFDVTILDDSASYNKLKERVDPVQAALKKLSGILSDIGPYLAMMIPGVMFPLSNMYQGISNMDNSLLDDNIKQVTNKSNPEILNLNSTMSNEEVGAIKKYIVENYIDVDRSLNQDYLYGNYLNYWTAGGATALGAYTYMNNLKSFDAQKVSSSSGSNKLKEKGYLISGDKVDVNDDFSVSGGAGMYNHDFVFHDWAVLGGTTDTFQIGGKTRGSLVHGEMDWNTDYSDAKANMDIFNAGAEARLGGTSVLGLPLPYVKAEGTVYQLQGRTQVDKNNPYIGSILGGTGGAAKFRVGNADAYAGFENHSVGVGAKASMVEGEVNPIIGIPFTDYNVKLTLGGSAGSIGGEAKIGKESVLDLRFLLGVKVGLAFEKDNSAE
ncbi:ribonuclease YeeF family protein [Oceanobacillus senegalensis]|uniref:ribonuclease YeeF family protein n=1 Tax=Oceanobacillus senegalensis TaxID=1936063 RepID=UPI0015C41E2D|nr:LXG domain-containing protein [Oceanobacillus senegalensis]